MSGYAEIDADLILEHSGFIRSLARGLIRDEALVDDVVQETLITALEKGPRRREALRAWLRTVTRNIAYKSYRSTARRRNREADVAQPERTAATADVVAKGEALESLTAAVLELPEAAREVIFLRYYEGLGHAEIAERLGIEAGAVRMRVHRAQKLLQERLDRSSGGDRMVWMSGLAGLLGIPLVDLRSTAAPDGVAAPVASSTLVAWTAALCAGFGALVWFGLGPAVHGTRFTEDVERVAAIAEAPDADDIALVGLGAEDRAMIPARSVSALDARVEDAADAAEVEPRFPEGNLVGTVVDRRGQPVPDARVSAAWGRFPMTFRTRTNELGRFGLSVPAEQLEDARSRTYSILVGASAEDWSPSRVIAYPYEGIDPGSGGRRLLLEMRGPGGAIEGRVLGPDGRPLAGAEVEIGERRRLGVGFLGQQSAEAENPLAPHLATSVSRTAGSMFQGHRSMRGTLGSQVIDGAGGRARLLPAERETTGPDGHFRFGGLEPSRQRLRITAPGCAPYTGSVDVRVGTTGAHVFRMSRGASVRGRVRRADGLPLKETLVHAIMDRPHSVQTVRAGADGEYAIAQLPAGPIRIVAEERRARAGETPTRIAAATLDVDAGEPATVDLELHPPASAPVRVVVEDRGTRRGLADMTIEVRAKHNPLLLIASARTDITGLALVPLETVVPCEWALTQSIVRRKSASAKGLAVETPIRFLDPPDWSPGDAAPTEELVLRLTPADLRPARVLLRPVVPGSGPLGLKDGVQLFRARSAYTFTGWPTDEAGVIAFDGVPPGEYRILYPHHGLGWISSFTLRVGASGPSSTVDLGTIELPRLGTLELRPATGDPAAPRWHDVSIVAMLTDDGAAQEISVFSGRVEVPTTIPIAPGRYRLARDRSPGASWEEIVVLPDEVVVRLWP